MKEVTQNQFINFINSRTKHGDAKIQTEIVDKEKNFKYVEDTVIAKIAWGGKYFIREEKL